MENRYDPLLDPIAILISGRGSNMKALIEAAGEGRMPARIAVVISNRADAQGLEIARAAGIQTRVIPHRDFSSRDAFDAALVHELRALGVKLVCLAGFMRRLGAAFCDAFPDAILNVHPSLLPSFPGEHAQAQAIAHGAKISGATVHLVTPELDAGPIVMQSAVPVKDDDTAETLATRILPVEHAIYPEAVRRILSERWRRDGRRIIFESNGG